LEKITLALKLMDIEMEALGIPPMEYAAVITMPSAVLEKKCSDMQMLGADTVLITPYRDRIEFKIECGMLGSGSFTIPCTPALDAADPDCVRIALADPAASEGPAQRFALRYLNHFIKAKALSERVVLRMSPEVPLRVDFDFGLHGSYLRYYLAPKNENEAMEG
jgi:proliferating cell nuclear antigen